MPRSCPISTAACLLALGVLFATSPVSGASSNSESWWGARKLAVSWRRRGTATNGTEESACQDAKDKKVLKKSDGATPNCTAAKEGGFCSTAELAALCPRACGSCPPTSCVWCEEAALCYSVACQDGRMRTDGQFAKCAAVQGECGPCYPESACSSPAPMIAALPAWGTG